MEMADNTDDDTFENPVNPQPDNRSDDITLTQETDTINLNQETENMEVHHHPNLNHKPKKWKEYFLEFVMIFLAVTMGFFAESYREDLRDGSKEREYIKSMVEDLKNDSTFLVISIDKKIPYHIAWMDSTVHLLELPELNGKDREIYQAFFLATSWTYNFNPTQRTLSQLHTEGFHLLKNQNGVKTISLLEAQYKSNTISLPLLQNMQNDLDASAYIFADRDVTDRIGQVTFKNYYLDYSAQLDLSDIPQGSIINTANKAGIQSYIEKLRKYSYYLKTAIKGEDISMLRSITNTIAVLKKEYDLD
jgi:hypothetical protein